MSLTAGTRLGNYEVVGRIGEGGMGQVFRARDTTLHRDVALKILPDAFTGDPDRLARFAREAQSLAALNHANIAQIQGVEAAGGLRAIVMELVEGDDLSQRIAGGALPVDEALSIATQIAAALEAAHERGIIHRDLKPANIKVRSDGTVKVLDFGLAKAIEPEGGPSGLSMSPTFTTPAMTQAGVIMGTAAYMAPEQAKGRAADERCDIWAFGCVLYEMLAGRPVFAAESVAELFSEILKAEPDWQAVPASTPAGVRTLLKRCLQKDRNRRLRAIADARFQIEEALQEPAGTPATVVPRLARERLAWLALVMVLAGALIWRAYASGTAPVDAPEMRLVIPAPGSSLSGFALSPDGRTLAYPATVGGRTQLWLRPLDTESATALAGTEGGAFPFWSPDSRSIAFFAGGQLKRVDIASGFVQNLAEAPLNTRGGSWNQDGTILFTRSAIEPLFRVAATGGKAEAATALVPPHRGHRYPQFLPDGRHFIFYAYGPPESQGIYVGSLDSTDATRLIDADSAGVFSVPDYVLYARQGALLAQRIDLNTLKTVGDPLPVSKQVVTPHGIVGAVALSASMTGQIAYRADAGERQFRWRTASGEPDGVIGVPDAAQHDWFALSPDGRTIAVSRMVDGISDLWLIETGRDVRRRLTADRAREYDVTWSPDGSKVVFGATRKGVIDLYVRSINGADRDELLWESAESKNVLDWSEDGRWLLVAVQHPDTARDIWALPLAGDKTPVAIVRTPSEEFHARFSPDGRWIAFQSNESGRAEIYVQRFPTGAKTQVSTTGGGFPRWHADGRGLLYQAADGRIMNVTLTLTGDGAEPGTPVPLFAGPAGNFSTSPDRQRFLFDETISEPAPVTILLNWKSR